MPVLSWDQILEEKLLRGEGDLTGCQLGVVQKKDDAVKKQPTLTDEDN